MLIKKILAYSLSSAILLLMLSTSVSASMEMEEIAVRLATRQCVPSYRMYCKGKKYEARKNSDNSKRK